ncbi:MAG: hypothetical protein K2X00_06350 [Nitrospiraceae bacterium]|jgi:hypothetical protein|nr:hypothetical protein [Nitrospiraceae bacterium]
MTLRTLTLPFKILASVFLLTIGVAYLFALAYLYLIDVEPHTKHGMGLTAGVIMKYYGQRDTTKLEAALRGPMTEYVTDAQRTQMIEWIRAGAREAEFATVQPILTQACAGCHSAAAGTGLPSLSSYTEVVRYTDVDFGQSIQSLVRVSHIHLFGMSFIFMLTSLIFVFSEIPASIRAVLVAIPFLAIWLDIGSWWFTKHAPLFAYIVIGGGALMGLSLALQIGISLYEMWFARTKH